MAILVTNAVQVARFANALYGIKLGSTTNAAVNADIANIGLSATVNAYYDYSFGSKTSAEVAAIMLANLGLTGNTAAAAYVEGQLNAAGSAKGVAVLNMLNAFSNLESDATFGAAATAWNATIVSAQAYTASNTADVAATATTTQTFTLTTGLDAPASGAFATASPTSNATVNALLDGVNSTLTGLDRIAATGTGNKLALAITDDGTNLPIFNMSGVQTVDIRSSEGVGLGDNAKGLDFSQTGVVGLQTVNITEAYDNVVLTVGGATSVNVSGLATGKTVGVTAKTGAVNVTATGDVTIAGGSTQTVSTQAGAELSGATGNVSVTNTKQGTSSVAVMDGASVTVTTTYAADDGDSEGFVGVGTATYQPGEDDVGSVTGAINITVNANGDKAADTTTGEIYTYGGSSVNITVNATQPTNGATTDGATNYTITQDYIMVLGTADTKTVNVTQTAEATAKNSIEAVADVAEVDKVTFKALSIGDTVTVAGLTFTATEATTAAQTAAAFANLADGATHGTSIKGVYSGSVDGWSSGAVSTASVSFTSKAYDPANVTASGSSEGVTPVVAQTTNGVNGQKAQAGVGGVVAGWVDVAGYDPADGAWVGAEAIEDVTLTNFAGAGIVSKALSTVTLTNGGWDDIQIDSGLTTLNLSLDNVSDADVYINGDVWGYGLAGSVETLNLTAAGADSALELDDLADTVAISALNINGDAALTLKSDSDLAGLETVTISGSVSVDAVDAFTSTTVTSVTSTTTGDVTAEINGYYATYSGSSGVDDITLSTSSRYVKNVSLGGGNDTLTLANDSEADFAKTVIATGVTLDGGTGTNTLSMSAADLDNITGTDTTKIFAGRLKNFSVLNVQSFVDDSFAIDLAKLTNSTNHVGFNHVVTNGVYWDWLGADLTINNLASGGTVEATDYTDWLDIGVKNSSTTDVSLNLVVSGDTNFDFGVNGVETLNITSTNTSEDDVDSNNVYVYDDLDQLSTVVINGDADIVLDTNYDTESAVTLVDASALTGALTYSTDGQGSVTVIGGLGDDSLNAEGDFDILDGGAGDDKLDAANDTTSGVEMTGGAGNDTFMINDTMLVSNADYATTIMDAESGDIIEFGSNFDSFNNTAFAADELLTLEDNIAVLLEDELSDNQGGWFEFAGDTYVVVDTTNVSNYVTGESEALIVKLMGSVDLSTATVSTTDGHLNIA